MRRENIGLAVRDSKNSVELVRRVVEGIITDTEANPSTAIPVDVHLLHVAIIFVDGTDTEVREGIKLIMTRLQPHLIRLPMTCTWHAHILALRRPLLSLHHDQEMMVAYALCRKAARLGCSELILKGKGPDHPVLPFVIGHTITHLVLNWSIVPVRLFSKSRGFCCHQARGTTPRGQDAVTWKQNLIGTDTVPMLDAMVVEQPDGAVGAAWSAS